MKMADTVNIIRCTGQQCTRMTDLMVNELPLRLEIKGVGVRKLYCSPRELHELILGHLYTQRYVRRVADVEYMDIREEDGVATVGLKSGAENAVVPPMPHIEDSEVFSVKALYRNVVRFYDESTLQKATAGVHRCAICDDHGTVLACMDISRHNAFDKAIGKALMHGIELEDKYIITSGRVPLDMMQKAIAVKIPMLVSRSTPTTAAVTAAKQAGMTLLGFARENRFNIYCGEQRLTGYTVSASPGDEKML